MTVETGESAGTKAWCVAAALKTELAAVRALHLKNVLFLETGVGPQNARRAIGETVDKHIIGGIIQIGFAGGLSQSLRPGDIVIAQSVLGKGAAPGAPDLPRRASEVFSGDIRCHAGTFVTCDKILATAGEKQAIAMQYQDGEVACVDMESAPVAAICEEWHIPYIGLRAITDTLDEDLPLDLNECRGRDGNIETMRVMWAAVHHPSTISGLVELRRRARDCANTLAACVSAVVSAFPTPEAYQHYST
jgi:adenosylhomocysteine nucleosidase